MASWLLAATVNLTRKTYVVCHMLSSCRIRDPSTPLHSSRAASPAAATAMAPPPRPPLVAVVPVLLALLAARVGGGVEILSKSRVERCVRDSGAGDRLSCDQKIVLDLSVPSDSSGGEATMVAKVVEVEGNDTQAMQTIRDPPVITINKTAAYKLYALNYLWDVAYRPEEQFVKTRKCEPDAGAEVVRSCERLRDKDGHVIAHSEPVCCPCGPQHRVPSSCGNFFDKIAKGKANTAHCLRFPGDWFHVFGIGTSSLGFSISVQVKKGSSISEVVVGPENRTVISGDKFLRVNLVGDFAGYTSIPSYEDFYLVTPRKGAGSGEPQVLGDEYSKWMLLERVRFTDGRECNKIGVSYEAFQNQPDFCSSPFSSCLYNQLWNFWEDDKNRVNMSLPPQYIVEGKFQRINQHPGAGVHTFSVGVTEGLNSNLLLELSADDIEYVYQRSPGKIISINVPTFEALTQVGTAKVTTKNIGKLEASYSLTFRCLSGISYVEEQFFIMKPDEGITRSFYLRASTDQAAKFHCAAILKASDFSELDREECQFSTRATVFDNGTQIGSSNDHKKGGIWGFFEAVKAFWHTIWDFVMDFFTGRSCSTKCSSVFDLSCHIQYICIGWIVMVGLLLAMVPTVAVLLWLLHQNGLFDPLYNWWEDLFGLEPHGRAHTRHKKGHHHRHSHRHGDHHHTHHAHPRRTNHHHVLHRHGEQQPGTAAAEGHRRHRHDAALGVQHREVGGHKHRHGKAAAELHLDGPRRQAPSSWLRGEEDGEVYRDRRRHERHAGHGQHDRERRHSRAV